jgi:hypothetical protein
MDRSTPCASESEQIEATRAAKWPGRRTERAPQNVQRLPRIGVAHITPARGDSLVITTLGAIPDGCALELQGRPDRGRHTVQFMKTVLVDPGGFLLFPSMAVLVSGPDWGQAVPCSYEPCP